MNQKVLDKDKILEDLRSSEADWKSKFSDINGRFLRQTDELKHVEDEIDQLRNQQLK